MWNIYQTHTQQVMEIIEIVCKSYTSTCATDMKTNLWTNIGNIYTGNTINTSQYQKASHMHRNVYIYIYVHTKFKW